MKERQGCGRFLLPVIDRYKVGCLAKFNKEQDRILLIGDHRPYELVDKSLKEGTVKLQKDGKVVVVRGFLVDHVIPKDYS